MAKCPVCGMDVNESTATNTLDYHGQTYYFCAPGCKRLFERDPEHFVRKA